MSPRVASIASCRSPSDSPPYARAPTLRPGNPVAPRVDGARLDPGRGARADLQRLERLPATQDRAHGQLLHPDRPTLAHDLSPAPPDLAPPTPPPAHPPTRPPLRRPPPPRP